MKRTYLIFAVLLIGIIFLVRQSLVKPVSVKVIRPIETTVEDTVSATGRIYESSTKSVYAEGDGFVSESYVKVGDEVKKGDKIALFVCTGQKESESTQETSSLPDDQQLQEYLQQYQQTDEKVQVDAAVEEEVLLTAPSDGVVTALNLNATGGKPIAVISDFSKLVIKSFINESLVSRVEEGQTVHITGEGFKGLVYTGRISNISPVAKQVTTGTYSETVVETTVDILNADLKLRPGFSVEINVLTGVSENAVVLPFEAVAADNEGDCVYVIEKGKAVKKPVKTGLTNDYGIEILSGIDKTAVVVVEPPENLSAAVFLTIKK